MASWDTTRRTVVQLLKDWADQFGSITLKSERGGNTDGHWLLTGEILNRNAKDTDVYNSKRLLARELRWMRQNSPYYTFLKRVFLTSDAAHSAYDSIRERAERDSKGLWDGIGRIRRNWSGPTSADDDALARTLVTYWEANATDEVKTEHAIDVLTQRCIDAGHSLYCDHPSVLTDLAPPTRKQTMEEHHDEIRRVFKHYCKAIQEENPNAKRYRNKAINNTATTCNVHRNTVIRAIQHDEGAEAS